MTLPPPHPAFPGGAWPAVPQPAAAALLAVLGQLEQTQSMSPTALAKARQPQLELLIDHAFEHVVFWRERLEHAGLSPARRPKAGLDPAEWERRWANLPILARQEVQEHEVSLRSSRLPPGHGDTGESVTSGSSGQPVRITRSTLDYLYWQAFQLREHVWRERDLAGKFLSILRNEQRTVITESAHLVENKDWGPPTSTVWPTGPSFLLDYRAPIASLVQSISEVEPDYLCTFPSLLLEILRHVREHGIKLPPLREAIAIGEACPPELESLCREVWQAPLASTYTAAETGPLAFRCREEERWHIQSEKSLVEVLDTEGRPCLPGNTGRIIVTPLHNFAMPLFRYEIGDLATVGTGPCSCGRTLPILESIAGRARDLLVLPSGELRPPYYGHGAVMEVRSIRQHRVVQTQIDRVTIQLVVSRALKPQEENHIIQSAEQALGGVFTVSLEYVEGIERGPNGKFAEFERQIPLP